MIVTRSAARAWLGEQTTIQGAMCIAGGLLWGALHGDWATGGSLIGVGVVALVLRETPAQVIAQARSIIGQAQEVKIEADQIINQLPTTKETRP